MSTYIVPGTKLTSLTALSVLTDTDLFYVVDTTTNTSRKTSYDSLTSNVLRDVTSFFLNSTGGRVNGQVTILSGISATNYFYTSGNGLVVPSDLSTFLYLSSNQTEMSKAASQQYVISQLASVSGITQTFLFQNFVALSGSALTGKLSSSLTPTTSSEYVNLKYITDNYIPVTGGTFTGAISVPQPSVGDPSTKVATVGYVESRIAAQPGSRLNNISAFPVNDHYNKHNNSGRGNSGNGVTFIRDNDAKVRSCGLYGNNNSGGFGFYPTQLYSFPQLPIEFRFNDGSEFITKVLNTGQSTFVLSNLGYIYTAGSNVAGQLGIGSTTRRNTFVNITSSITSSTTGTQITGLFISQGNDQTTTNNSVYLLSGGQLWAWGSNKAGQLGFGITTNVSTPGNVNLDEPGSSIVGQYLTKIAASNSDDLGYVLAIDANNIVHVAGWNGAGQLGLSAATTGTGAKRELGKIPSNITKFQTSQLWTISGVYVSPQKLVNLPVLLASTVTADEVYTAGSNSYILSGGRVLSCGKNGAGACGIGNASGAPGFSNGIRPYWQTVVESTSGLPLTGVEYLTTNGDPTSNGANVSVCAYLSSLSGIAVWGSNSNGQLGTGDYANKISATRPSSAPGGILKVKMVGQQTNTTLFVLDSAGDIYVTGDVDGGLDGRGEGNVKKQNTFQKVIRPQGIRFTDFEVFSYGNMSQYKTVLAQTLNNELYAWGYNTYNQCGFINIPATKQIIDVPIKVSLF
jgi:alpha-tubulin suppressor-like RCC1 family protein